MNEIGFEAGIVLGVLIGEDSLCVCESEISYAGLSRIEVIEARLLLALVQRLKARLERLGTERVRMKPERILITGDLRILVRSRNNMEIHLQPLPKALFLLYLRHPEGLAFKELPSHMDELMRLYGKISPRTDREAIEETVRKMLEPGKNTLSVNCSRLAASLQRYFEDPVLQDYLIKGEQGESRQIALDRSYVEWE